MWAGGTLLLPPAVWLWLCVPLGRDVWPEVSGPEHWRGKGVHARRCVAVFGCRPPRPAPVSRVSARSSRRPGRPPDIPLTRCIGAVAAKFDRIGGVPGTVIGEAEIMFHNMNWECNYAIVVGSYVGPRHPAGECWRWDTWRCLCVRAGNRSGATSPTPGWCSAAS